MEHTIKLAYKLDTMYRIFEAINNSKNILSERANYLKVNKEFGELLRVADGIDNQEIKTKIDFCKEVRAEISKVLSADFATMLKL